MNPRHLVEVHETVGIGGKDVELVYNVMAIESHSAADERQYVVGGRAETVTPNATNPFDAPAPARRVPTKEEYLRAFEADGRGKPKSERLEYWVSKATRCLTHVALRFEVRGMPRRVARAWTAIGGSPMVAAYSRGLMAKLLWHAHESDRREARREGLFRELEEGTRLMFRERLASA